MSTNLSREPGARLAQALRALAHPSTVAWVLILLLNDLVLRWAYPSWITGKLSDVAWLAIAPLAVAVPVAILASALSTILRCTTAGVGPARRCARIGEGVSVTSARSQPAARERSCWSLIAVSIGLVGLVFAVIKSLPGATAAFRTAFQAVLGWRPLIVCDPSDLLALPAMAFAWWRWRESADHTLAKRNSAETEVGRKTRNIRRGSAVLALIALASLGNAGPPDEGIVCLELDQDRILAGPRHDYAYSDTFASDDGGLSWTSLGDERPTGGEVLCSGHDGPWTLTGTAPDEVLRFVPGERIERSTDSGATWTTVINLNGEDARMAYYATTRSNSISSPGPHDALVDPASGNVIVAMGHEGVLVRTGTGDWEWIAVGEYRFELLRTPAQVLILLQGELGLAIAAGFVAVAMAGWRRFGVRGAVDPNSEVEGTSPAPGAGGGGIHRFAWPLRILMLLAGLGVALALVVVRPATIAGYGAIISWGVVIAALAVTLVLAAVLAILQARVAKGNRLLGLLGWLALTPMLVLLPYLAWVVGWLPTYTPASWIAAAVAAVVWVAAAVTRS
ncbi:MAG: hypothetical protein JXC32_08320 [Anaerolineae bacterium]|nr:hypothetical protein [Anaerolineae bacterium]